MDIDDLLSLPVPDFVNFLDDEMKRTAGKDLMVEMVTYFGNEVKARKWYYNEDVHGTRPYDFCRQGRQTDVSNLLVKQKYGIQ